MSTFSIAKKEIRLKVAARFYKLLQKNADLYGLKPTEYIVHLILNDIKRDHPPYITEEQEADVDASYKEVYVKKQKAKLKGFSAREVMKNFE